MKKEVVARARGGRVNISISLPQQMGKLIDHAAGEQMQNRSEFVREAVREKLIARREPIVPTKAEERDFEEAMRDYRAGRNFYTLDEVLYDMGLARTRKSAKKSGRGSKKR